jgi:nucleotide-binding universal stress UspA family protein
MSIKRILVPLPGSAGLTGQIETAVSAAKALGAHVQALFISEPPPVTRGGLTVTEMARTATDPVNWHAEERERTAREAREVSRRPAREPASRCHRRATSPAAPSQHPGAKSRDRMWKSRCNGPLPST